jgi:hypothetical protein
LIFENIYKYYYFLGSQDKKNKVSKKKIKGFNKILVKKLQKEYDLGYKKGRKK